LKTEALRIQSVGKPATVHKNSPRPRGYAYMIEATGPIEIQQPSNHVGVHKGTVTRHPYDRIGLKLDCGLVESIEDIIFTARIAINTFACCEIS
jgi:hypothetical protein